MRVAKNINTISKPDWQDYYFNWKLTSEWGDLYEAVIVPVSIDWNNRKVKAHNDRIDVL